VEASALPAAIPAAVPKTDLSAVLQRLDRIEGCMGEVAAAGAASVAAMEALARERDRHRADTAAAREVALRLTGVTRDVVGASRQLLDALETQAEAVGQLVGPGSLQDLLP
jgi:hypothetical protein